MRKWLILSLLCLICTAVYASPRVTGRKAVTAAGTAERLDTGSYYCSTIIITAFEANTDVIVIGDANVDATEASRTGLTLFAGQTEYFGTGNSQRLSLRDTWIDSEVNGEGATWTCLN